MRALNFILILLMFLTLAAAQDTKENADFKLAVSLYNDKLYDLALEQFRQFVATYPNTPQGVEARFYLGLTQLQLKNFEDARFTFQNFALSSPEHPRAPDAWWNVGEAYARLGNPREAALAFERVKTFHPKSKRAPAGLLEAARYFEEAGDTESAKKVLRSLGQEYASADVVSEGRLKLARIYYRERQYELARAEAKRVADVSKDPVMVPSALQLAAESLARLGKLEEAKLVLSESMTKFPAGIPAAEARLALGKLHWETGNFAEASRAWEAVTSDAKTPAAVRQGAFLALGDASMSSRQYERALRSYEGAIAIGGTRLSESSFKAARAAERLGQSSKAGQYYLNAVNDSASTMDRRVLLAGAFQGAGLLRNPHLALRFAEEFRADFPDDPALPRMILEAGHTALSRLGDERKAIGFYDDVAAAGDTPFSDDALFGKAMALRGLGDAPGALQVLLQLGREFPASDFRQAARDTEFVIRTFELKEQEGGIRNLALLIGDVVASKPRSELAFRLGEIYFSDLKDYGSAAEQYETSLKAGLEGPSRALAAYRKAQALEFLSFRNLQTQGINAAIAAYDSFLTRFPATEYTAVAQRSRTRLILKRAKGSLAEVRKAVAEIRPSLPQMREKGEILLLLGEALRSERTMPEAAAVFTELLRLRPSGEIEAQGMMGLASAKFSIGESDTGAVILESLVQKYPQHEMSAAARRLLAQWASQQGKKTRALQLYDELDRQFFYTSHAHDLDRARGDALYEAGDFGNALVAYTRYRAEQQNNVFADHTGTSSLLARLADCHHRTGNRLEAKRLYAEVLAADTSSQSRAAVLRTLASIAREENNLEAAARYLQEASTLGGGTPEQQLMASIESADLLFRSEDYRTAITRFEELLTRAKEDSLRRFLQARLILGYFRLDNAAEAEKRATAFVRAYPGAGGEAAEFEYERGRYHLRREETDFAIRRFENVRQRFPKSEIVPETVYWLARAMELNNRPERAIQLYDSLLQRFPGHPIVPRVQLSLGNVYYNLEQWDAAARQYKAVVDNPQHSADLIQFAMSNLIMAQKEIGLFDAALQLTRQYIDRFPDDPDLVVKRIDIGVIYQKLGYYDQSILHLQNMLENATPELEGELRYYIGEAYFYKGDYQQSILEFLKVPYLITKRTRIDWVATSYYMAGQAYEKMSRFDQAITMYKQIIERPGIDVTFKTAAQKEIDRVNALVKAR